MQQAYGSISCSDGSILNGSGNFSVAKTGAGKFTVTINGSSSTVPTVTTSVGDPYMTATVQISWTDGGNGKQPSFGVNTGYVDQGSKNPMDIYVFSFIAIWN
jgi:hypothetical protein